jgi:hypothetical protein
VRDLPVLFLHLLVDGRPIGWSRGVSSVIAESVLVKQQLLILNRCRNDPPISASLTVWSLACVRSSSVRAE